MKHSEFNGKDMVMRKIFVWIALLSVAAAVYADENIRQVKADWKNVSRDAGKKSKKVAPAGEELIKSSSKYQRDLRRQQNRELQQLREIHEYQTELFQQNARKQSASADQRKKKEPDYRMQIRRNVMALENTLGKVKDFPFAKRMHEIDKVVNSISSGKLKYGSVTGKSPQKILKSIQDDQIKLLRSYQKQEMKNVKNIRPKER